VKKLPILFILVFLLLVTTACRLISPTSTATAPAESTSLPAITVPPTEAATQAALPTPTPRPTAIPATVTPFAPIRGTIGADNFKLRSGPGFYFDTIALYKENSIVEVYGQTPGSGWYYVVASDHLAGWMKSEYLTLAGDAEELPFMSDNNASLISGHVRNNQGQGLSGISVVLFSAEDQNSQDNTLTNANGEYFLYLPASLKGNYTIGINGYNCQSNAVDSTCNLQYGFPSAQSISLPYTSGISIEFVLPPLQ
jgi:uncharacterized protein YraI